jgi:CheY-like chemotaxis protein
MMASKARILVVEDDGGVRGLLADRLMQYELVFATCQSECYAKLETPDFDLVLLDLKLPKVPGEMAATNQVGIDILIRIRDEKLRKRGSTVFLPVIVMTAHGSERLPSTLFQGHGATDYIPKPFGEGQELEHMITRALEGAGALTYAADPSGTSIPISFHPSEKVVRIATLMYRGAHCELLRLLSDNFVSDLKAQRHPDDYQRMRADDIAEALGIEGKAVRTRVKKFRQDVERDFKTLGRTLDKNDIIHNNRDWTGYRLNPDFVRIVAWKPDR